MNSAQHFPANYSQLNWLIKLSILDQVSLTMWELQNHPRIVPDEAAARKIGLATNWRMYLDQDARDVIAGKIDGRSGLHGERA